MLFNNLGKFSVIISLDTTFLSFQLETNHTYLGPFSLYPVYLFYLFCIFYPFSSLMLQLVFCSDLASLVAQRLKRLPAMQETWVRSLDRVDPWRRKWQPTPVFLPGESHGRRSLVGYSPWGRKESDTTDQAT